MVEPQAATFSKGHADSCTRSGSFFGLAFAAATASLLLDMNQPARLASCSRREELFKQETIDEIAAEVAGRVSVPFVPRTVVEFATAHVIHQMASDLSPKLLNQIRTILVSESSSGSVDDVSAKQLDSISEAVVTELNGKLDLPFLDEEQERDLLFKITRNILHVTTTSKSEFAEKAINASVKTGRQLLNDDSRAALVKHINESVDIPFLSETQEQQLLKSALDSYAGTLSTLLPDGLEKHLKGESPAGLKNMKKQLINRLNKNINIPGLSETQERWLIAKLIDTIIDSMVDGTDAEFLLMSPKQKRRELNDRRALLRRDLKLEKAAHERRRQNIGTKLERIAMQLKELEDEQRLPRQRTVLQACVLGTIGILGYVVYTRQ